MKNVAVRTLLSLFFSCLKLYTLERFGLGPNKVVTHMI